MLLKENTLTYEIYTSLRQSVGWNNWSREQTVNALENSYCTVTAFDKSKAVGMGRVVGDGMYFTIVDVVGKYTAYIRIRKGRILYKTGI